MNNDQSSLTKPAPATAGEYLKLTWERRWVVRYPEKSFYLTQEEAAYFMEQIKNRARYVRIGRVVLSKSFLYLYEEDRDSVKFYYNPMGE